MRTSPLLKFSLDLCRRNCRRFVKIVEEMLEGQQVKVYYALKANPNETIASCIFAEGIGAEVITEKELELGISKNVPFVANGYYKSQTFLTMAIQRDANMIHVESLEELDRIESLANQLGKKTVNVGIRVKMKDDAKLGMPLDVCACLTPKQWPHCFIRGLHFHAGWNQRNDESFREYLETAIRYYPVLISRGFQIDTINVGGSFCEPTEDLGQLTRRLKICNELIPKKITNIHFEPGRYLVGNCGNLEAEIVEKRDGRYCLNTCAYVYRIAAATPHISVIPKRYRTKDYPSSVILSGYWPCEEDVMVAENLEYLPQVGDRVIFHNVGAYCNEFIKQFEYNNGLEYTFATNFSRLNGSLNPEETKIVHNNWDYLRDRFSSIPRNRNQKNVILKGLSHQFLSGKLYEESAVNKLLREFYDDFCMLRRDLVETGHLKRNKTLYTFHPK